MPMSKVSRRALLAGTTALCLVRWQDANAVALVPILLNAKPALEISLNLFKTFVDLQNEMQAQRFNEAAVSSIKTKLNAIEDGIRRIEREVSSLKDVLIGELEATFLIQKIADLRSKWGSYNTFMGGKETLDDIESGAVRRQTVEALRSLKSKVVDLVEEIKVRGGSNPLIVTPVFSAFSLIKAINARLIEDRDIFDSKKRMQSEFNAQLNEQFVKWREALADPRNPNSLHGRKQKLERALPQLKARVARFKMLDGDFRDEFVGQRECPVSRSQVARGLAVERSAACMVFRARENGWWGWSKMKFGLVDTRVMLTSHYGCPDSYFPAELFDLSSKSVSTISEEMSFSETTWENPAMHFQGQSGCAVQTVETIEEIEKSVREKLATRDKPELLEQLREAAIASNRAQAEMMSVLSAWVFVAKEPTMDEDGGILIGASYLRDTQVNKLFDVPVQLLKGE